MPPRAAAGGALVWLKTEHAYPGATRLASRRRRLGEILLARGYVSLAHVEAAAASGVRMGDYLLRRELVNEDELYSALGEQQGCPVGAHDVSPRATRVLPAAVSRKWRVLPFQVREGRLMVAGTELPSDEMATEIRRFCPLEVRFHLVTPREWETLAREYLP